LNRTNSLPKSAEGLKKAWPQTNPLVVAMDDSIFHKSGRKILGVGYRRHGLGALTFLKRA